MSLDKLSKYKVNTAFTEGVVIHLDNAPDVAFKVKLPGPYNRPYMAALYGSLEVNLADGGASAKTNVMEARAAQINAFVTHCLVDIDGDPVPADFADEYPAAVDELVAKANDLADAVNTVVEDASGKSSATSLGSVSGATG